MNNELTSELRKVSFQYKLFEGVPKAGVVCLGELADTEVARDVATQFQTHYRVEKLRHAGSLAFQRAAHRIVGINIANWMLTGCVFEFSDRATWLHMEHGATTAISVADITTRSISAAQTTEYAFGLIQPLVYSFHIATGVGVANLKGNIAATIGAAVRNVGRKHPSLDSTALGNTLLRADPTLEKLGWFEELQYGDKRATVFYRNSCCHWYTTGAEHCDWCTHRGERRRRNFLADLRDSK
ncbi:hypothetical protein [Corynebacterium freiburgense]|uniref:hypothetical protein n=1 Tax=Corynebacterium freiburgense TaxID=556548 RepID=UPI00041F6186|nr:hypothetical protein [Corynebacterium freiburgense]WJZ02808.1 hypothetical protein CFREI_07615 [Corynebacterium freiburgense]